MVKGERIELNFDQRLNWKGQNLKNWIEFWPNLKDIIFLI